MSGMGDTGSQCAFLEGTFQPARTLGNNHQLSVSGRGDPGNQGPIIGPAHKSVINVLDTEPTNDGVGSGVNVEISCNVPVRQRAAVRGAK